MEYLEYCWSCGLDYNNSLFSTQGFQLPALFENRIVLYLLRKLFSALGACIIFTFLMGIGFETLVGSGVYVAMWVGIITSTVVYTYGIICSILIDLASRFIRILQKWYSVGIIYLILGLIYPFIFDLSNGFNKPINMIFGIIVSLIFWGLQNEKVKKEMVIIIGLISLVPFGIVTVSIIN